MTDISSAEVPALAGEFPAFDEATWRQLVDKVLKGAAADEPHPHDRRRNPN